MMTMTQTEDRLMQLTQQHAQLTQEIQGLDSIRQQAVVNLYKLEGAIQALREIVQEQDNAPTTEAEPSE
jgi:hypothetical protein